MRRRDDPAEDRPAEESGYGDGSACWDDRCKRKSGWARDAHVPAVQGLEGLALTAVAASRQQTAEEAAHAFDVAKAYGDGLALIADPEIDIVAVATRVPDHRDLVLAAIAAGKHVYSEWPLGRGGEEARAAQASGKRHVIGLQLRASPAVRVAREIAVSGALGRLLSISTFSATAGFGPEVAEPFAYLEDPANFANLVTIQATHTLDLVLALGGDPVTLAAQASRQFPEIVVGETRERRERETYDHLLVHGRLLNGAPFGLEVAGGRSAETPFHLDLVGEHGLLRLDGGAPRGLQSGRIGLVRDGVRQQVDEGELAHQPDPAVNVAGLYALLRDDIRSDTHHAPGFNHAERLTRLIQDVFTSSELERRMDMEHSA